ncbi:MAG: hypothetical protein QM711_11180 [Micropruina sp.]|uniref:hypothetical protein n=1 Tax=Micropruina sp. TaxID=2737536 RepID=UPI0039E4CF2E
MARQRISTTVDAELLARARALDHTGTDASMIERALRALLAEVRAVEIDRAYSTGYAAQPMNAPDEWGDLASFGAAVRTSGPR